jgi:hypothetical protein
MSAPSKIEQLRDIRGRLPRVGVALTAMIAVIALLAFGPVMPRAGVWRFMVPPPASPAAKLQAWAGYLENPAEQSEPSTEPLTSASYTSGFDKAAAGLAPESVPTTKSQQTRDPRACPDGLNCSFRTASAVPPRRPPDNSVAAASAPPPPAASDVPPAVPDDLPPADVGTPAVSPPAPHPSGLAALTSELPSPHTLLRPFTFVANTFTGFIRKL